MKKVIFGMLAVTGLLMGSCSADDQAAAARDGYQTDGGTGGPTGPSGGNGSIPPPVPPPPPGGG